MKCLRCEYPLWRMKPPGPCPECGAPFNPSQHRFQPGSVHFLCPTCGVAYLGNDADGLPTPRVFACVQCAGTCDVSMMAVVPASAAAEEAAVVDGTPWDKRRKLGFFKGFFTTLGWSLGKPTELGRSIRPEGGSVQAAWFSALISVVAFLGWFLPFLVVMLAFAAASGSGNSGGTVMGIFSLVGGGLVAALAGPVAFALVVLPVWALLAHLVLILGGAPRRGVGTTMRCCWYASGPIIISGVPCFGLYLSPVSAIWAGVSATNVLRAAQGVSGVRAFFAAFTGPALFIAAVGTLFFGSLLGAMGAGAFGGRMSTTGSPSNVSSALVDARAADGTLPDHVLLGANLDRVWAWELDASRQGTLTLADGTEVQDLGELTTEQRDALIAAAGDGPFYMLGDVVFAHRGVNIDTADGELWLAFKDPRLGVTGDGNADPRFVYLEAHRADGMEASAFGPWAELIEAQNALREAAGLPPIPLDWSELPARTPEVGANPKAGDAEDP